MYIDDLELCKPLGCAKKKHSITAVYFQLGNVEQKHLSARRSVLVACITKSAYVRKYGLDKVLESLYSFSLKEYRSTLIGHLKPFLDR